jgi:hypothetical protein
VTQLSGLDVVFLHDLVDGLLHHQGRTGTVRAASKDLFVIKFSHYVTPFLII